MSYVAGVGDEVLGVLVAVVASAVIALLWKTTQVLVILDKGGTISIDNLMTQFWLTGSRPCSHPVDDHW